MQKGLWQRVWDFIWHEDSVWSWLVNLVLAFVIIKFIFYPLVGLVLGTSYPLVAVVSGSMEHDGSFDTWWNSQAFCKTEQCTQEEYYAQFNISEEQFKDFRFNNGFSKGDVMILTSAKNIAVGDVIVFLARDGRPIIHRVISTDPLETKGDHNVAQIISPAFSEKTVSDYRVLGKATVKVPLIGYIKILFTWIFSLVGIRIP